MSIKEAENQEQLLDNYPDPISVEGTTKILEQMKTCACLIYKKKGGKATGFFCNIFYEKLKIPVLMTNHHVIEEDYIKKYKSINLSVNGDKEPKNIKITENRVYYSNKDYDTTIIELFAEKDNISNFLEIDDKLFYEDSENFYENESLYVIQYPNQKLSVSYGKLKEIQGYELDHFCSIQDGSSGSNFIIKKLQSNWNT